MALKHEQFQKMFPLVHSAGLATLWNTRKYSICPYQSVLQFDLRITKSYIFQFRGIRIIAQAVITHAWVQTISRLSFVATASASRLLNQEVFLFAGIFKYAFILYIFSGKVISRNPSLVLQLGPSILVYSLIVVQIPWRQEASLIIIENIGLLR